MRRPTYKQSLSTYIYFVNARMEKEGRFAAARKKARSGANHWVRESLGKRLVPAADRTAKRNEGLTERRTERRTKGRTHWRAEQRREGLPFD